MSTLLVNNFMIQKSPIFIALVSELKSLKKTSLSENEIMQIVAPYVKKLVENVDWIEERFYSVDAAAGFNGYKLHEEDDHTMAIFVTSWLPYRGAPPHNHGTWTVIGGVLGEETNTFWNITDKNEKENFAKIKDVKEVICKPKEVLCLDSSIIHSVQNKTDKVTMSLQVYGKHPNYTPRVQFNNETHEMSSLICKEV